MTVPRTLTADQTAAVEAPDRVCLVLAPAGSGKTEVLIRRVIRLLDESCGASFRVLAVTFTLRAADELQQRVERSVGQEAWRVDADTIHGLALDWLRRFGAPVGVAHDAAVYAQDVDRLDLLRGCLDAFPEPLDNEQALRVALERIDRLRTDLVPPDAIPREKLPGTDLRLPDIYDSYVEALRVAGGVDFPGMLDLLIQLLEIDPTVERRFRRTYHHVLVDEGQDLTHAQAELLKRLVGGELGLFVVADDRQSINAWAGGGIQWARELVGEHARELCLLHNFRCATRILGLAHVRARHFLTPRTDADAPPGAPTGSVSAVSVTDEKAEAAYVVDWAQGLMSEGLREDTLVVGESPTVAAEEIGIVARTRYALEEISAEFGRRNMTVSVLTDINALLTTAEARLLHALLELRVNPHDRPALRRASEELALLLPEAFADGIRGSSGLGVETLLDVVRGSSISPIADAAADVRDDSDGLDALVESLGGFPILSSGWGVDTERIGTWWGAYRASTRRNDRTIEGFLRHLFRVQRTRPADPGIRLLTTHRAKGTEFRAVAVVGLSQGGFPDYRSLSPPTVLDEERRAFYVAITRASRALLLTWPQQRRLRYGGIRFTEPSQFLIESGLHP
ncbi:MAG: ATP-dependent helicase [Actinomycetota bacterium]